MLLVDASEGKVISAHCSPVLCIEVLGLYTCGQSCLGCGFSVFCSLTSGLSFFTFRVGQHRLQRLKRFLCYLPEKLVRTLFGFKAVDVAVSIAARAGGVALNSRGAQCLRFHGI